MDSEIPTTEIWNKIVLLERSIFDRYHRKKEEIDSNSKFELKQCVKIIKATGSQAIMLYSAEALLAELRLSLKDALKLRCNEFQLQQRLHKLSNDIKDKGARKFALRNMNATDLQKKLEELALSYSRLGAEDKVVQKLWSMSRLWS